MNMTVCANPQVAACDLAGEVALLNVETGVYYGLNSVGARIWELIQQPESVSQVCDRLLAEYDVTPEQCHQEVLALLDELALERLIRTGIS